MVRLEYSENLEIGRRFLDEAKIGARLKSAHVARVLDFGTHEGVPFMVMEFLQGEDLRSVLDTGRRPPVSMSLHWLKQACSAVSEAHALGIVHRDLKPENLFLTRKSPGVPSLLKVLDFGVSKWLGGAELTWTGEKLGSPGYMAPEQVRSAADVDARADIWSLGAILFELLTGRQPFDAATVIQTFNGILHHPAPDLRALRPDLSVSLERVIARCLRKDRNERYQSVDDLRCALDLVSPSWELRG
jgi:serine/threonine-protein kinase